MLNALLPMRLCLLYNRWCVALGSSLLCFVLFWVFFRLCSIHADNIQINLISCSKKEEAILIYRGKWFFFTASLRCQNICSWQYKYECNKTYGGRNQASFSPLEQRSFHAGPDPKLTEITACSLWISTFPAPGD